jgi:nucleosome binding factor SPN SPT16 subunit
MLIINLLLKQCTVCWSGLQDIKVLRNNVIQRDRERAERATLVAQEKLIRGKVSSAACSAAWSTTCLPCLAAVDSELE